MYAIICLGSVEHRLRLVFSNRIRWKNMKNYQVFKPTIKTTKDEWTTIRRFDSEDRNNNVLSANLSGVIL